MAGNSTDSLSIPNQQLIQPRNDHHQIMPVSTKPEMSIIMHPHVQAVQPIAQQLSPNEALFKSYDALIQELSEIGRDIKPCYQGNRASVERLKRGITQSKARVRECLNYADRLQKLYNTDL
ncbi:hypothetical protein LOD99_3373 [Oopsacas minuta]|uniref:Uncharacterized protein n=1 Tax=Oopsacas minuta TaxID=111878 RepID=A0AAV7JWZ8_9METZ|nr:hypothetical protein LOD99_3373 [Oopsacas minuta]